MKTEEIIIAGFGGQGVMLMGKLLAYSGMKEGKEVSWMPSYGPEMRGGTANCTVIVSDKRIASPVISKPSTSIVMNRPSLDKFGPKVRPEGNLFVNSSLIEKEIGRDDVNVIKVPANEIANNLGNGKVANMVMLGAFITKTKIISFKEIVASLEEVLPERRHDLLPLNKQALKEGKKLID